MNKPYVINLALAFVLIAAGLYSYFSNPMRPPTALIGPGVGLFFALMTPWMIKENKIIAHVVVLLTLLFGLQLAMMAGKAWGMEPGEKFDMDTLSRRRSVFTTMAVACFIAIGLYVKGFIDKKKAKKAAAAGTE